jgi:heme/copper-type cytochrome/quinol oxidase subunit 2
MEIYDFKLELFFIFIVACGILGLAVANNYSEKKIFGRERLNTIFLLSTILLFMLSSAIIVEITNFRFNGKKTPENDLLNEIADVQIIMVASIKPWTFNASVYQNRHDQSFTGYATNYQTIFQTQNLPYQLNMPEYVSYSEDINFNSLKTNNITVKTNQLVHIIISAWAEDHRLLITDNNEAFLDYFGNESIFTVNSASISHIYLKTPDKATVLDFRCTSFCGAGHPTQRILLIVTSS